MRIQIGFKMNVTAVSSGSVVNPHLSFVKAAEIPPSSNLLRIECSVGSTFQEARHREWDRQR